MQPCIPPPELYSKILEQISYEQRLGSLRRKLLTYALALAGSLSCLLLFYPEFIRQSQQSGLFSFLSLLGTDFQSVRNSFLDYFLSLAEAVPAISLGLLALAGLATFISTIQVVNFGFEYKKLRV